MEIFSRIKETCLACLGGFIPRIVCRIPCHLTGHNVINRCGRLLIRRRSAAGRFDIRFRIFRGFVFNCKRRASINHNNQSFRIFTTLFNKSHILFSITLRHLGHSSIVLVRQRINLILMHCCHLLDFVL